MSGSQNIPRPFPGGMKTRKVILPFVLLSAVFVAGQNSLAQCIPVASESVRGTCGGCHQVDSHLCMSRISYQRKTPEGWEDTVRRMGRMNGIPSSASQARRNHSISGRQPGAHVIRGPRHCICVGEAAKCSGRRSQ